jgi:hypothetical protein
MLSGFMGGFRLPVIRRPALDIDMTPDGRFVIAYSAFGMGGGQAFARLYDSNSFPRGLPFLLAGDVTDPKVAVDSTGAFVLVWNSSHDTSYTHRA